MNTKIASAAASLTTELVQFLRDIIAIPSPCGSEGAVIERIRREMEKIGYDRVWVDPMGNLFGRIGSGERIIAFDGHCDTVDVGNPDNWKVDPFSGDCRDGIIYGRGAADQKGGLASAIYSGKIVKSLGVPEDLSLVVCASVLEEGFEGMSWKYIIEEGRLLPQAVVLTEPSDMTIKIGQRGRMEMKLKAKGVSSHGSTPELGDNAIYKVTPVIQEIRRLNNRLAGDSLLGKGSIVVTDIRSEAPSLCAVPDSAIIHIDRRVTVGENLETSLQEIRELDSVKEMEAVLQVPEYAITSYTGLTARAKAYVPLWLMEETDPLVKIAKKAFFSQFNRNTALGVWKFSTNGVATKGMFDIPTIGFGPGNEKHAHAPDEEVKIEDCVNALSFYAALVFTWMQD